MWPPCPTRCLRQAIQLPRGQVHTQRCLTAVGEPGSRHGCATSAPGPYLGRLGYSQPQPSTLDAVSPLPT